MGDMAREEPREGRRSSGCGSTRRASGEKTVTYAEALDVALCYGWIDGLKRSYDEVSFIQRFTPRRVAQCMVEGERRPRRTARPKKGA